ncbi:hypothetical protein Pcinc_017600 [Petrolisthes cinctipes]|uniref:Uncharacterized protein n=1 Tax=Petrolisthes cinctipes TaxID=88211 RepID=A0AAE1FPX8_PETCI|nr:hypothetical protein Pcinc_017600 [Petrolisthes cinctipes]
MCLSLRQLADLFSCRSGQRHSESEDEVKSHTRSQQQQQPGGGGGGGVSCVSSRFEDTATLESHWAPPHQYGQQQQQQQHQQQEDVKVDTHSETSSIITTSTTSRENQSEAASSVSSRKSHSESSTTTTPPPPHRSPSESSTSSRRSHHSDTSSTTTNTTTSSRKIHSESSVSSRKSHSESSISSSHENQSEAEEPGAKTLKDVNNVAQTERLKTSRTAVGGVGVTENGISTGGIRENGSSRGVELGETCEKLASVVLAVEKKEETDLLVTESVVLKDSVKEKDIEQVKSDAEIRDSDKERDFEKKAESIAKSDLSDVYSPERRKLGKSKEKSEVVNARLKETILGESEVTEKKDYRRELEERRIRREERVERRKEELLVEGRRRREREWSHRGVRGKYGDVRERESSEESEARRKERSDEGRGRARTRESSEEDGRDGSEERMRPLRRSREARTRDKRSEEREAVKSVEDKERIIESEESRQASETIPLTTTPTPTPTTTPSKPGLPRQTTPPTPDSSSAADVVVGDVVSVLKAETVYVSSSEDISQLDDSRKEQLKLESPEGKIKEDQDIKEKEEEEKEKEEEVEVVEKKEDVDPSTVRRQLFPDVLAGTCEGKVQESDLRKPSEEEVGDSLLEEEEQQQQVEEKTVILKEKLQQTKEEEEEEEENKKDGPIGKDTMVPDVPSKNQEEDGGEVEGPTTTPPLSPRAHSLAALDALIHGRPQEVAPVPGSTRTTQEEDEIMYDHTVTSAQHKIQVSGNLYQ